jgi:hypothetical protein
MTVPELQSGARRYFSGDVFLGLPNKPHYDDWPWKQQKPIKYTSYNRACRLFPSFFL